MTDGVPSDQRLHRSQRAVGEHHDSPAVGSGSHECRRVQPASQCFFACPQVGSLQERPAIEQQGRTVAALSHRLRARRRDHQRRVGWHDVEHVALGRGSNKDAGKRSAELFGGPSRANDGGPIPAAAALWTLPRTPRAAGDPPTPPAGRCATCSAGSQHAPADRAPKPRPAAVARQGRQVTAPRDLNQNWAVALQRCVRRLPRQRRQPAPGRGLLRRGWIVARPDHRSTRADLDPAWREQLRPCGGHQPGSFRRHGVPANHGRGVRKMGPQHEHFAHVRVGRPRLCV